MAVLALLGLSDQPIQVAGGFAEATAALSAWVAEGKAQLAERALANENEQGPDPALGPAPGLGAPELMNAPQPRHA